MSLFQNRTYTVNKIFRFVDSCHILCHHIWATLDRGHLRATVHARIHCNIFESFSMITEMIKSLKRGMYFRAQLALANPRSGRFNEKA